MKKILSALIVIALVLTSVVFGTAAAPIKFTDVKTTDWYYNDVQKLLQLNITAGAGNNMYKPSNSVTRAEFVTFMCKALGLQPAMNNPFIDTAKHWADGYITIALANNMISVPKDKKFRPNDAITRAEAVEIMCKALNINPDTKTKSPYADVTSNSGYTTAAYNNYLMRGSATNGKTYFRPGNKLTRGEVAKVIINAYDYHADLIAFLNKMIDAEKKKAAAEKEKAAKYQAWQQLVKDIPSELLNNTKWLNKKSLYESYEALRNQEFGYLKNWGAGYNMTPEQFENEMVRVGTEYANMWANANYNKIDEFKDKLDSYWAKYGVIMSIYQDNIDYVKNNTIVTEGKFMASKGTLIYADGMSYPALMGTIRYKYSSPTSTKVLNSEIVDSTGKASKIGVWYEQDFIITYAPEKDSLRVNDFRSISKIRIAK